MTINQRIAHLLKMTGISQTEFCKITGYDKSNLSNIIRGRTKSPKIEFLEVVAKHYKNWNLEWLLTEEGEPLLSNTKKANSSGMDLFYQELGQKTIEVATLRRDKSMLTKVLKYIIKWGEKQIPADELDKIKEEFEIEELLRETGK